MKRHLTALSLIVPLVTTIGCSQVSKIGEDSGHGPAPGRIVSLEQNWSPAIQERFWFTDQGSRIIPYGWFLALERAENDTLIRADSNIEALGYMPVGPSGLNPDGLPIGFAKTVDRGTGQAWMGLTCAACHTGQVDYQGVRIRIEGGQTLGDFDTLTRQIVAGLRQTKAEPAKFQRFADNVLGIEADDQAVASLRQAVQQRLERLQRRQILNQPPSPPGHARIDAFGNIFNEVFVEDLGIPENKAAPSAPVSYPFLWDTPQHDVVQWNGAAPNAGIGPLLRNVGEVLGVFAEVDVDTKAFPPGYPSSINIENLGKLEKWLIDLWSPQWPEAYLPAIDQTKAQRGESHYQAHCLRCHAVIDRTDPKRRVMAVMTPLSDVGTDPAMAKNAAERVVKTGRLAGTREMILFGERFGETAPGTKVGPAVAIGVALKDPLATARAGIEQYLKVRNALPFDPLSYKARPLNGIWATAPYLHNGSVPNLWQLLQPAAQRDPIFWIGSYEFDPEQVGFLSSADAAPFQYDTRLPGNRNSGHEYGSRELSETEKWELVEYLKTL